MTRLGTSFQTIPKTRQNPRGMTPETDRIGNIFPPPGATLTFSRRSGPPEMTPFRRQNDLAEGGQGCFCTSDDT
jgi:hypothetical protein